MDRIIPQDLVKEPSENEREELKLFIFGGDSSTKLGSPNAAQEMHKKAVFIFPPLCEAILRGDRDAALQILEKWPTPVVNYPLEAPQGASKVSCCHKIIRLMDFNEDLTKLILGDSAGVEITGLADVSCNIAHRAVRDTILRGDIKLAAQILHKFFPAMLHDARFVTLAPYFLLYQELIELTRQGNLSIALWLANHSLRPMTESHPWLKKEVDKLFDLMLSSKKGIPSKICYKELLEDSQRQKTANSVAAATFLILLEDERPYHPKGTFIIKWLKRLEDLIASRAKRGPKLVKR